MGSEEIERRTSLLALTHWGHPVPNGEYLEGTFRGSKIGLTIARRALALFTMDLAGQVAELTYWLAWFASRMRNRPGTLAAKGAMTGNT